VTEAAIVISLPGIAGFYTATPGKSFIYTLRVRKKRKIIFYPPAACNERRFYAVRIRKRA